VRLAAHQRRSQSATKEGEGRSDGGSDTREDEKVASSGSCIVFTLRVGLRIQIQDLGRTWPRVCARRQQRESARNGAGARAAHAAVHLSLLYLCSPFPSFPPSRRNCPCCGCCQLPLLSVSCSWNFVTLCFLLKMSDKEDEQVRGCGYEDSHMVPVRWRQGVARDECGCGPQSATARMAPFFGQLVG